MMLLVKRKVEVRKAAVNKCKRGHPIFPLSLQSTTKTADKKDGGPQYDITYLRGRQAREKMNKLQL